MKVYEVIKKIKAGEHILEKGTLIIEKGSNYAVFQEYCVKNECPKFEGFRFVSERRDLDEMIEKQALKPYIVENRPIQ